MSGIVYKNSDGLSVLKDVSEIPFDLIYLDAPQNTGGQGWNFRHDEGDSFEQYKGYMTALLQACVNALKENGVLCFECPIVEDSGINFRMALEYCFARIEHVLLEMRPVPRMFAQDSSRILYFCSKQKDFELPVLWELPDEERFRERDARGAYALTPLDRPGPVRPAYAFEWHGVRPKHSWCCSKENLDDLYADDRIVLRNGTAYRKRYRQEHPVPITSPWPGITMDPAGRKGADCPQYIDRVLRMFAGSGSRVLCLYDDCARFALACDQRGLDWVSLYLPRDSAFDKFSYLPKEHYVLKELPRIDREHYHTDIPASVSDVKDLQQKARRMMSAIQSIQATLNIETNHEEDIEAVLSAISTELEKTCHGQITEEAVDQAKRWIDPFWDKLEKESQIFLPTGVVLETVFADLSDVEKSLYILEYCKTLEKELLNKLFKMYIRDLYRRRVHVRLAFAEDFKDRTTKPFAQFVGNSIRDMEHPDNWKFEMGKMIYTLENVLEREVRSPLYDDFRDFLPRVLENPFFRAEFMADMEKVRDLRNDSAHHIIRDTDRITTNKAIIRSKLLTLLKYYK